MLKIVFMGTPDFAVESLKEIVDAGYNVEAVVTNTDKQKGRGMKTIPTPVKQYALEQKIEIYQPEKIRKNKEFIEKIKKINPDVICVVAYGKILPKEILDIPKLGCINVHGSLLPEYRGAAPIQWAVINGDKITGVTTMYMDVGMDTGDIILKKEVEIGKNETTGELWERLAKEGGKLLVETLKKIENNTVTRTKQSDNYTMAPMLEKEIAKIDWENKTAKQIKDLIRGLNPIMGAYAIFNDKKIKIWKANIYTFDEIEEKFQISRNDLEKKLNGEIIIEDSKLGLYIKAKDGIIEAEEIQGENAKKMSAKEYLRGKKI